MIDNPQVSEVNTIKVCFFPMLHVPCGTVRDSALHSHLGIQVMEGAIILEPHHLHISALFKSEERRD